MGRHDQDNTKDGQWPRPVPKDDIRNDPKDGGGRHSGADESDEPDEDKK
jgi:hypothetical protein